MAHQAEDISKIEDIGQRLDALLDALEESSQEVARVGSALDTPLEDLLAQRPAQEALARPAPAREPKPAPELEPTLEPSPEPHATEPLDVPERDPEPLAELPDEMVVDEVESATELDDGLLIEPERSARQAVTADIDGAPTGPMNLEQELDEELEALLASGVFEDPLQEMGVDESAVPIELPEEPSQKPEPKPQPSERRPNLPASEDELIGELDAQLAALADAQLAEGEAPEPVADPEPVMGTKAEPVVSPTARAAVPVSSEPAPQVVTRPAVPAAPPKRGWQEFSARAASACGPVARRVLLGARAGAKAAAVRMSAPLAGKPQLKQIIGWVGLVQAFLAACVWAYIALWHNPPPSAPSVPQPTLEGAPGQ